MNFYFSKNHIHYYIIEKMFNCWIEYIEYNHTNAKSYHQGLRDKNFILYMNENYGILIHINQEIVYDITITDPNKKLLFDLKYEVNDEKYDVL